MDGGSPNWEALAAIDTVVVLMAVGRLGEVCQALIRAGRSSAEPAAIIEAATTAVQRIVFATLGTIGPRAGGAGIRPPATLVIGQSTGLAQEIGVTADASVPLPLSAHS